MAITLGATSEQLIRGIDRLIGTVSHALPGANKPRTTIPRAWASERGTQIASYAVDITGGFPGSIRNEHRLKGTRADLTDRYVIVGEGTPNGFALPLDYVAGASISPTAGIQPDSLVLWYQDADHTGSFLLDFRGTARNRYGVQRAQRMQDQLAEAGVPAVAPTQYVPPIHCQWSTMADVATDEVIWSGAGVASVGGPFGSDVDDVDMWLTERNLLWVARHGHGLNRLPLENMVSCRNGYGDRLAIGIEDPYGGRYDLYFDLGSKGDRSQPAMRVQQYLAAAGVPISSASTPHAPWRMGGTRRPTDF